MPVLGRRSLTAALLILTPVALPAATFPAAQTPGVVLEPAFRVHTTACWGFTGPNSGSTVTAARCSPGGAWGPYLYVTLKDIYDPFSFAPVVRMDKLGRVEGVTTAPAPGNFSFSAPGSTWGDRLWLHFFQSTPMGMGGFDSTLTDFDGTCAHPYSFVFDRSGDYGYQLYTGSFAGIVRLNEPHNCNPDPDPIIPTPNYELFSTAPAFPIAFGPGRAWGNLLYATPGTVVQPDGTFSTFPFPFGQVTFGDGGSRWLGDMFARQSGGNPGDIYRVTPNGTATLFATGFPGELVFCNGDLWVIETAACSRIVATGPK